MRPHSESDSYWEEVQPLVPWWGKSGLIFIALGIVVVFGVAIYLNPYDDGKAKTEETHRQLGLPPCTFKVVTGYPCPSCGMTTSFSLLAHGDPLNSLRANWVGTGLAVLSILFIPWAIATVVRGKPLWIKSFERVFSRLVTIFLILMIIRWGLMIVIQLATTLTF